jgi:tetrahydromethanopterin S-methyltransferase subunit B
MVKTEWNECGYFVLESLKRIEEKLDGFIEKQDTRMTAIERMAQDNRRDIAVIKAQAIFFGAFAGILVSALFQLIIFAIRY